MLSIFPLLNTVAWVEGNIVNKVDPSGRTPALAATMNAGVCNLQTDNCFRLGLSLDEMMNCFATGQAVECVEGSREDCEWCCWSRYSRSLQTIAFNRCVESCEQVNESVRRNRCDILKSAAERISSSGQYNGRAALSELIRYAHHTFNYDNAADLSDDISCAITGARGADTLFQASGATDWLGYVGDSYIVLGSGGWHSDYDDATNNQSFHFWSYVNSAAQGGSFGALLGDLVHECYDFTSDGRSLEDTKIAITGVFLGIMMAEGLPPGDVARWVDEWLGVRSFDDFLQTFNLEGTLPYLNNRICPLPPNN